MIVLAARPVGCPRPSVDLDDVVGGIACPWMVHPKGHSHTLLRYAAGQEPRGAMHTLREPSHVVPTRRLPPGKAWVGCAACQISTGSCVHPVDDRAEDTEPARNGR